MLSLAVSAGFAFQAPSGLLRKARTTPTKLQAVEGVADVEAVAPPPLPVIETIQVGGKQLAGDAGFDPLQLADSPKSLAWYREAEVKHARLAMLAAAGWPLAEKLNFGGLLTKDGRAPSLLNGGLDQVSTIYWAAALGLAVYVESGSIDKQLGTGKRPDDYLPGMIGFDPLGMDSPSMRNAEITNGRVAMIAITAFALEEAILKAPVTDATSVFFQPIWTTLGL